MTRQVRQLSRWIVVAAALLFTPTLARAQEQAVTITGRVTNESGEPLRAANVSIPLLNLVVYVGADGSYRLSVPGARAQGQQVNLSARMIGYQSRTIPIRLTSGTTITQNFTLPADPLRLQEIVVTGAGTESLVERLGTARASVQGDEVEKANQPNLVTALAGKVPNVLTH